MVASRRFRGRPRPISPRYVFSLVCWSRKLDACAPTCCARSCGARCRCAGTACVLCCSDVLKFTLWLTALFVGASSADVPSPAPLHDSQRVCAVRLPVRSCASYSSAHVGDLQTWESHCVG